MVDRDGIVHWINAAVARHNQMTVVRFSQADFAYAPIRPVRAPLPTAANQLLKKRGFIPAAPILTYHLFWDMLLMSMWCLFYCKEKNLYHAGRVSSPAPKSVNWQISFVGIGIPTYN